MLIIVCIPPRHRGYRDAMSPPRLIIARNSVFAHKGTPFVLADVARDLGVRFAIEGSVRRTGDQIRLNAQLVDIANLSELYLSYPGNHASEGRRSVQ
jgi:hypothetical protein